MSENVPDLQKLHSIEVKIPIWQHACDCEQVQTDILPITCCVPYGELQPLILLRDELGAEIDS